MEGNLKDVRNHKNNVYTTFRAYWNNHMRVAWRNLRHVNRQKCYILCQLTTSPNELATILVPIQHGIGNLSWCGIFPIISLRGMWKNVLKMHEKRPSFKIANFLGGRANEKQLELENAIPEEVDSGNALC